MKHKYLQQYSESEAKIIAHDIIENYSGKPYEFVLTIPAYRENSDFFLRLKNTLLLSHHILLIVVINQPDDSKTPTDINKNQQLWDSIHQQCDSQHTTQGFSFLHWQSSSTLLIDRFSEGQRIPKKQGVGLARKIACDIACHLIDANIVKNPWIHTTDADTRLPDNYFLALAEQAQQQHSAAVYGFKHQIANGEISNATQSYEKALNYYVEGLEWAGSPYSFHTMGSCIAIHAHFYMQARGYPKRAGGEDFYLLNKMAKLGSILKINHCEIKIDARLSDRVPFGTGPAVEKILQTHDFDYYNPEIFLALKAILQAAASLFDHKNKPRQWLAQLSTQQQVAVCNIGIENFFTHLSKQINTATQCRHHWHDWLDAFKTLKLIHALEKDYPKVAINQAIAELAELKARIDEP